MKGVTIYVFCYDTVSNTVFDRVIDFRNNPQIMVIYG